MNIAEIMSNLSYLRAEAKTILTDQADAVDGGDFDGLSGAVDRLEELQELHETQMALLQDA